jgi:hypothetical protein
MPRIYKAVFDNDVNDPEFLSAKSFSEACKKAEKVRQKRQREARYKINGGDGDEIVEIDSVEYKHSFK